MGHPIPVGPIKAITTHALAVKSGADGPGHALVPLVHRELVTYIRDCSYFRR
jgi:hypothetical protein